jgi:hypothetical protein
MDDETRDTPLNGPDSGELLFGLRYETEITLDDFFTEMDRLRRHIEDGDILEKMCVEDCNTACSSMDVLEDTYYAISFFVASAQEEECELGERYLRVYGVLQAFALQQDAITSLCKALGAPDLPDLTAIAHIRELRVAAVGHPTLQDRPKCRPRSAHFISRITLDRNGFQLLSGDGSGKTIFRDVLIPDLAREQETHILELLRRLTTRLIKETQRSLRE